MNYNMDNLKIVDLYGAEIVVSNLPLAILKADDFRHYRHINPEYAGMDESLQVYWEDVYEKLNALMENQK